MSYVRMARALGFALLMAASGAYAQVYPTKPVRFVVGFAAGGASDTLARIVGQKLADSWGQNVLVDNRIGAGGTIAANMVVRANPDGYTIFVGDFGPSVLAGSLYEKLSYDPAGDFIHVPAFLLHMEINPSTLEPFRWVVVRSTATPIVVNLPDDSWP